MMDNPGQQHKNMADLKKADSCPETYGHLPESPKTDLNHSASSGILKHNKNYGRSVSSNERLYFERLVCIAVDGSCHADYALDYYLNNIHQDGNFVVLIHAFEMPERYSFQDVYASQSQLNQAIKRETERIKHLEDKLKDKLRDYEVPCKFIARSGKSGESIVKVAEEQDVDLILVGTRGHGKLRRTLMGSVSSYVVHHAHCPVTVCRPKAQQQRQRSASGNSIHRCRRPDISLLKETFRKRSNSDGEKPHSKSKPLEHKESIEKHHVSFAESQIMIDPVEFNAPDLENNDESWSICEGVVQKLKRQTSLDSESAHSIEEEILEESPLASPVDKEPDPRSEE